MDTAEFVERRRRVHAGLPDDSLIVVAAGEEKRRSADDFYRFTSHRNFFYLTGINQPGSVYMARKRAGKLSETLYMTAYSDTPWAYLMKHGAASDVSGIERIADSEKFGDDFHRNISGGICKTVALNLDALKFGDIPDGDHILAQKIAHDYPYLNVSNAYPQICAMRTVKSAAELDRIRRAADLTGEGMRSIMRAVRAGVYEYELEAEFNYALCKKGERFPAFKTDISSGERNFCLHYNENSSQINDGELILVDAGALCDGYCADISRMFPSGGKFTPEHREVYEVALRVNDDATEWIKPGATFSGLNEFVRDGVADGLNDLGWNAARSEIGKYCWHGVVHHIGLDVHDVGDTEAPIRENMAFTVDVGIYSREKGIGLRVEDNVVVTQNGCRSISRSIPRTVDEIEALIP